MEEENDLREYINVLVRHWYWIVGLGLVAAVVAFAGTSFQPAEYQATAVIVVTQLPYLFQFDPSGQAVPFDPTEFAKSYPTIATSDDLLLSVASAADPPLPPKRTSIDSLKKMLSVETDGTSNLIRLVVRSDDAEEAARLANVWALELVDDLNKLYGRSSELPLFEAQLAETKAQLEEADRALAALRREYGLGFPESVDLTDPTKLGSPSGNRFGLARRLQAKTGLLVEYEARADQIAGLLGEAQRVAEQVDDTTSPAILSGLLADMARLGLVDGATGPMLGLNLAGLDAEASLAALIVSLEAKQASTDVTVAQLSQEVEALQAELADKQGEMERLLRDRQAVQSTYQTLANLTYEANIEAQDEDVQLLSRAAVPRNPVDSGRLRNTAVAGVLGLMMGILGALFLEYWRQEGATEAARASKRSSKQISVG